MQLPLPLELLLEVELAILTSLLAVLLDPGRLSVKDPVTIIPNVSMVGNIGHRNYSGSSSVSPLMPERKIIFKFRVDLLLTREYLPTPRRFRNFFSPFVNGGVRRAAMPWELVWFWNVVEESGIYFGPV